MVNCLCMAFKEPPEEGCETCRPAKEWVLKSELAGLREDAAKWRELQKSSAGLLPNLGTLAAAYRRLREVEGRAEKELETYKDLKNWADMKGRAQDLCKVLGREPPEWCLK